MNTVLWNLLNQIDAVAVRYEEVNDTDVREQLAAVIYHGFIVQTPGYIIPKELGMFQPEGNAALHAALVQFLPAASAVGLPTPQERFAAFQDSSVRSDAGHLYDEYFGHSDSLEEFSTGMLKSSTPGTTRTARRRWQFWK